MTQIEADPSNTFTATEIELRQRAKPGVQKTHLVTPAADTAPDDGFQAWMRVFGSFMVFLNIWGFTFVFGVFQSYYEFSYLPKSGAFDISWIGTTQSALLVIVGVLAGPLFDLGANRIMLIAGSFFCVFGLMMLSLSTSYYQVFLSQGVCVGIGGGLLYVPCLALVGGSFTKKRAIAVGIMTCGIGLGGVIYVVVFERLLPQLGFPWTVRVMGFIALGVFLIALLALLTNANLVENQAANATESNDQTMTSSRPPKTRRLFDRNALHDQLFLTFSIASFFIFLGYLVPFFYIPAYGQYKAHLSKSTSFYALAIPSATSILGRLVAAVAAHHLGVMLPWVSCAVISSILCFAWTGITTSGSFFVFCALYGFFSGALVALPPSIFPHICLKREQLGTWMGMGWLCSGVAFLIGSPIAGALTKIGVHDDPNSSDNLNFLPVQIWSGVMLLLGTMGLTWLWRLLVTKRKTKLFI